MTAETFPQSTIPLDSAPESNWLECLTCGRKFPDIYPSGRCPFEYDHTNEEHNTVTDYYALVIAIDALITENNGNDPDSGVTLLYSAEVYAAYAWLNSLSIRTFVAWRDEAEEAYAGEYGDDEDFARDMAENTGSMPADDAPWPLSYIDWERAARDLMFDYSAHAGFYFRNQ